jgi:peptide-methionine (S)-S-oxide reductase
MIQRHSPIYKFRNQRFQLIGIFGVALLALAISGCNAVRGQVPEFAGAGSQVQAQGKEIAVLAGGCFWGVDAVFKHVKGVKDVLSGYSGGEANTAEYEVVSGGRTGHAESVKITFDPSKVTYAQLLRIFFSVATHPTQLDRQGPDEGTQYRSVIFYSSEAQKQTALAYIDQLNNAHVFRGPIVTQVVPLAHFYNAEDYHQNYLALHPYEPYIVINDQPKVRALKKEFPTLFKP